MARAGAAVLLAPSPPFDRSLETALGPARTAALRTELVALATEWTRMLTGEGPQVAADGEPLSAQLVPYRGPLLVLWPVLSRPRVQDGEGAIEDLRSGADLVLGPVMDGGLYLLGLARPAAELVAELEGSWEHDDAMPLAVAATRDRGLEVGVLRVERALRRLADAEAAVVDPLLPEGVAAILRG